GAGQRRLDDLLLAGTEGRVPEVAVESRERMGCADRQVVKSLSGNVPCFQGGDVRELIEVPVVMEQGEPVPQGANSDQAVDAGAYAEARSSRRPVELRRLLENVEPERGLDDRQSKHGLPRNLEGVF